MASSPAAVNESKASVSLLRLSAAAEKAAAGAEAAKQHVRAAKVELKKARKLSKAAKKAAKQARKKVVAARAAGRSVAPVRAVKVLKRKPGSKVRRSAAQVAHTVISRLSVAKPSNATSSAALPAADYDAGDPPSTPGILDATSRD